jgi:hypothetical protein
MSENEQNSGLNFSDLNLKKKRKKEYSEKHGMTDKIYSNFIGKWISYI